MNTGKRIHDEAVRAHRLASVCPTRCLHCDWTATGTLEETREAYRAHRTQAHPDLPPPRRRIKLRAGGWQMGDKRIDDDVAAARRVGAGRGAR